MIEDDLGTIGQRQGRRNKVKLRSPKAIVTGGMGGEPFISAEEAIKERDQEIIVWVEDKLKTVLHTSAGSDDCGYCALSDLIAALRNARPSGEHVR